MTSQNTGFINFTVSKLHRHYTTVELIKPLHAPFDHIIMISAVDYRMRCPKGLTVYAHDQNQSGILVWKGCDQRYSNTYPLEANNVTVKWSRSRWSCGDRPLCTMIYFSFHPKSKAPIRLKTGLYNCSVDHYWRFQKHLDCNLKVECEDGRDEAGHCPFSSPACNGWMAFRDKCYKFIELRIIKRASRILHLKAKKAVELCGFLNASIWMVRNSESFLAVRRIIKERMPIRYSYVTVGLSFGDLSVHNMYRRSLVAFDKSVIHHSLNAFVSYTGTETCFSVTFDIAYRMSAISCSSYQTNHLLETVCEYAIVKSSQKSNKDILFSNSSFNPNKRNVNFSRCPNGEHVHMFLSLYPHNACDVRLSHLFTVFRNVQDSMISISPFMCSDGVIRLSYTLVCDFRHHCTDGSDETFCRHSACDTFSCSNGQCVSYSKRCDLVSDCLDDSDELSCNSYTTLELDVSETRSPVLITFNGINTFIVKKLGPSETCPETHYRCPGEYNDCLPVYTQCNGWYDCMDHEDEKSCEDMICPGLYRCFNSTVCVHADHLCDGWPHCPQHDDEWLCDMTCPALCLCQGYAFLCSEPFTAYLFPHLRYLDASGSGMTPSDIDRNLHMVHLRLSDCSLTTLPVMLFFNLQFLDLSANNLTFLSITAFTRLANLRSLSLAKNPIDLIHHDPNSTEQMSALRTVDLSCNKLTVFDSKVFSNMIYIQRLNLSFSSIHTISSNGFQHVPKLTHLYLAGNPLVTFSANLLKPLAVLRTLSSQTYKLCCRDILPDHFEMIHCDAPTDEISSCGDLLQSWTYRGFLWLISFLSLLGNVLCLVARVCVQGTASTGSFHVFVTNLSSADLLMGVNIAIIGAADSVFRGKYLFYDEIWKHSVACKVAGFLSLLSCEVSALTIWLITLDRFIVLHFPFSSVRFQRKSAAVTCLITWFVGLLLGSIPLLPVTSHWEFYSQTGICIPLPVNRPDFEGKTFSVSVFIIFNFVLFVLIASGQAFIYWSVQKNALNTDSAKVSRDLTIARRLISVAVTDFLCWFPIGLCGLLALADIPIPGEANVALAIFVLPLNSALNPFMYTFNMLMEKRRKSREVMLQRWLASHSNLLC